MLTLYHSRAGRGERPANLTEESLPENVAWIDLLRPQPDEVAFVKRTTGLDVPSIADLSEIESSSRLRNQNGAIYLSAPLVYRADSDQPLTTPVGFVLTRERLITVRFEELNSFTTFANRDLAAETDPLSSAAIFAGLMDAIADRSLTYSKTSPPNSMRCLTGCFEPRPRNLPPGAPRRAKAPTCG
jgi:magnesium transporter